MSATVRTSIAVVLVVTAVAVFRPSSVETQGPPPVNQRLATLEAQVAALQNQVTALQAALNTEATARTAADTGLQTQIANIPTVPQNLLDLASYVSVNPNTVNNLVGPHVIFTGANVHIRNGTGMTFGINGVGNLIIGYDEEPSPGTTVKDGSHNIAVGDRHSYSSYGGLVAGAANSILGPYASISGGAANTAIGVFASVSGGVGNNASERYSSVSGGSNNRANGLEATVSGGAINTASGRASTVSGGVNNVATDPNQHLP